MTMSALALATEPQTPPIDVAALKTRQQAAWSSGDYAVVGTTLQIVGEELCEALDLRAGQSVLDVAAGNGNASLAAARRWCDVTATDYVPALLERARERARAERLNIAFREADAEALPFRDKSFDVVVSTFGVMFTPDQERAASELVRVTKPGGKIGLANWTPEGFIGQLFKTIGKHLPPPAGVKSPASWGTRARLAELFEPHASSIEAPKRHFVFRYRSPEHWLDGVPHLLRPGAQGLRSPSGAGAGGARTRSHRARRAVQRGVGRHNGGAERVPRSSDHGCVETAGGEAMQRQTSRHPLDRPVWSALESRQAALSVGNHLARRFAPGFGPFAAARDDQPEALEALEELIAPGERLILLQAHEGGIPGGAIVERRAAGVQMVLKALKPADGRAAVVRLGPADVPEMRALADLTKPGPFELRTHELGAFYGVRDRGGLIAMAGERMKLNGFVEVSAVCTHPDYRGHGYAAQLTSIVSSQIAKRGETAFLHAYATNTPAIALYEALGFAVRREMIVTVLARRSSQIRDRQQKTAKAA